MIVSKQTVISNFSLLLITITLVTLMPSLSNATPTCLYCKRADDTATLFVSYSFCKSSDTCLQDKWLYLDRPCTSGWRKGKKWAMTDCTPTLTTCHSFVSS